MKSYPASTILKTSIAASMAGLTTVPAYECMNECPEPQSYFLNIGCEWQLESENCEEGGFTTSGGGATIWIKECSWEQVGADCNPGSSRTTYADPELEYWC
jgi:hypothetical protein